MCALQDSVKSLGNTFYQVIINFMQREPFIENVIDTLLDSMKMIYKKMTYPQRSEFNMAFNKFLEKNQSYMRSEHIVRLIEFEQKLGHYELSKSYQVK